MMEGKMFLIAALLCILAGLIDASPAVSPLRQALRRAAASQNAIDPAACSDAVQCITAPNICAEDADLGAALCPVMCGVCACEDSPSTGGNCTSLAPAVCDEDLASTLCPKTCGICTPGMQMTTAAPCMDRLNGINCADLPDPCGDDLGKLACPKFCGLCTDPTTTTVTVPTTAVIAPSGAPGSACAQSPCLNNGICRVDANNQYGFECICIAPYTGTICESKIQPSTTPSPSVTTSTCSNQLKNQNNLPCQEGEIVFLIEYSYKDSTSSIDHEGDFIKELVDAWRIKDAGIRFGVVVYHDTVTEAIHIGEYANDPDDLKSRISSLTRRLRPSGDADLAKALDYVRQNSFQGARPGAVKVAIPIIHQMTDATKNNIVPAADKLKADCVSIVGIAVGDSSLDYQILHNATSQPYRDFYSYHRSFYDLENAGKYVHYITPGCATSAN